MDGPHTFISQIAVGVALASVCACGFFPRELHIFLDTGYGFLSLATLLHLEMECGWLRVVRDQRREATREGATAAHSHTHTLSVGPHDTDSTFLGHGAERRGHGAKETAT